MRLSYSGWSTYDKCPAKYKYSYIDKLARSEPGEAAQRGTKIHDSVEKFFQEGTPVSVEIRDTYQPWLESLAEEANCAPEWEWGVNDIWGHADFKDDNAAWRGFFDLKAVPLARGDELYVYEWKTGKIYDDHAHQSSLYAAVGLCLHPWASSVTVTNVYFDQGKNVERKTTRKELPAVIDIWNSRRQQVMNDDLMSPTPSFACRWCNFSKANGGPCRF
jgi:hypothetical protein